MMRNVVIYINDEHLHTLAWMQPFLDGYGWSTYSFPPQVRVGLDPCVLIIECSLQGSWQVWIPGSALAGSPRMTAFDRQRLEITT